MKPWQSARYQTVTWTGRSTRIHRSRWVLRGLCNAVSDTATIFAAYRLSASNIPIQSPKTLIPKKRDLNSFIFIFGTGPVTFTSHRVNFGTWRYFSSDYISLARFTTHDSLKMENTKYRNVLGLNMFVMHVLYSIVTLAV